MMIRDMFADDINRKINGVIKVDQAADDVIEQELNEYVITRELKKHFITFFNYYGDAFDQPTADMGVWISGFFGSGKSHFLKMLSYLLENKEVKGIRSVERFRKKFEDDPATFMLIDRAIKGTTETILFNIDIEGFSNKDKTAVLRVFAKMFYNHLGFYGENLKVAMMERYIDQQGKTEEFRRVFEEKKGKSWLEMRRAFAFNGKFIIPTLMEVLDMGRPAIVVMVVNGSVCYFIAFFTRKFPRKKQMQGRWVKFIQPEKQFHHFGSVTSSGIIEGIRIDIKSLSHFINQIFFWNTNAFFILYNSAKFLVAKK